MARIVVRRSVDEWVYTIVGTEGILLAMGWVRGSRAEARAAAEAHAREKGLVSDA